MQMRRQNQREKRIIMRKKTETQEKRKRFTCEIKNKISIDSELSVGCSFFSHHMYTRRTCIGNYMKSTSFSWLLELQFQYRTSFHGVNRTVRVVLLLLCGLRAVEAAGVTAEDWRSMIVSHWYWPITVSIDAIKIWSANISCIRLKWYTISSNTHIRNIISLRIDFYAKVFNSTTYRVFVLCSMCVMYWHDFVRRFGYQYANSRINEV